MVGVILRLFVLVLLRVDCCLGWFVVFMCLVCCLLLRFLCDECCWVGGLMLVGVVCGFDVAVLVVWRCLGVGCSYFGLALLFAGLVVCFSLVCVGFGSFVLFLIVVVDLA